MHGRTRVINSTTRFLFRAAFIFSTKPVDGTAAIEDRIARRDSACRSQSLPRRAGIRVSELVVAKVLAREVPPARLDRSWTGT